jgi:hypothetical protein
MSVQEQLLAMNLKSKLFESLILNRVLPVKNGKIPDGDRFCYLLGIFCENFANCDYVHCATRTDVLNWVYSQMYLCLPIDSYGGYWPSHEILRCLLAENVKSAPSPNFFNLFKN